MTIVVEISEALTNNYVTLKADVADWLARDDLGDKIARFITLAESDIAKELRVRGMETISNFTITVGTTALPLDFLGMRRIYTDFDNARELTYLTPERFHTSRISSESGTPSVYTIEGNNILFAPAPTATSPATMKMLYIKPFAGLVSDTDSNSILTNYYEIYLTGALKYGFKYLRDNEEAGIYNQKFTESIATLNRNANRERVAGTKLIRTGTPTP
jgi:hypothetical protein